MAHYAFNGVREWYHAYADTKTRIHIQLYVCCIYVRFVCYIYRNWAKDKHFYQIRNFILASKQQNLSRFLQNPFCKLNFLCLVLWKDRLIQINLAKPLWKHSLKTLYKRWHPRRWPPRTLRQHPLLLLKSKEERNLRCWINAFWESSPHLARILTTKWIGELF